MLTWGQEAKTFDGVLLVVLAAYVDDQSAQSTPNSTTCSSWVSWSVKVPLPITVEPSI